MHYCSFAGVDWDGVHPPPGQHRYCVVRIDYMGSPENGFSGMTFWMLVFVVYFAVTGIIW